MNKYLLFSVIVSLAIVFPKMDVFSTEHTPAAKKTVSRWQESRTPEEADADPILSTLPSTFQAILSNA